MKSRNQPTLVSCHSFILHPRFRLSHTRIPKFNNVIYYKIDPLSSDLKIHNQEKVSINFTYCFKKPVDLILCPDIMTFALQNRVE